MANMINRCLLSLAAALLVSSLSGFVAGCALNQALLYVLGAACSLTLSSAVNFDMSEVMNGSFRSAFTTQIKRIMRWNAADFALAAAVFTAAMLFPRRVSGDQRRVLEPRQLRRLLAARGARPCVLQLPEPPQARQQLVRAHIRGQA